ncbi:JAB1/Mov34/MPN/PAD-1 ubiquitin protease-domain-containing protein [Fimicolochytrium jonesii]|uniref:JAB1/Mov34/MPN/PAD-1 ubiquitin protease-domain-containing protein n=1 Tax=Fimicolochytrium jonesii TaxID=1396493 RepID=UPI0022FEED88|nr:JAB1/Mov34/MPN/PAD-1 ubiquitin protease-domain-containing protein [Fimicolochytrium jonesii]KAI8825263.1 JAB1/Mov34/MPN/PAD-1 ubiquitin protease-domain-containing protein [Fimicolochytrium jonesii]
MDSDIARKRWEMENEIKTDDSIQDAIFRYDKEAQKVQTDGAPWAKNPNHFKKVKISAIALIKMVTHARSGGNIEIMGLMQGKVLDDTMIIMDVFALPVEGTETRVNAAAEGYEYMVDYIDKSKDVGRMENAIGWYHSHPGYGCWLSGIDVSTQMLNQRYQEPWVAIVIDPNRTISAGKVEIGAFRTYPEGHKGAEDSPSEYQSIPLNKIEDFGVHAKQYYQLEISYFKSSLDSSLLEMLWHKYWVNTLSSSPLIMNREYTARRVLDLAEKIDQAEAAVGQSSRIGQFMERKRGEQSAVAKVAKDSSNITVEAAHGMMAQLMKDILFNHACHAT